MRKAASLLELVIAIVVMGIAMMTLPLMLTTTQSNNTFAMQQEAILAARTQLGDMLTYFWDENSVDANGTVAVLDTNSTNSNFERNTTIRRIGHVKGNKRRKYFASTTPATHGANLGQDGAEATPNDIDDFNNASSTIDDLAESAGKLDYRFDFNMTTSVTYADDNFTEGNTFNFKKDSVTVVNSTNIKMVKLTLLGNGSSSKDLNITLRAYSCNLGANQLLRRDF